MLTPTFTALPLEQTSPLPSPALVLTRTPSTNPTTPTTTTTADATVDEKPKRRRTSPEARAILESAFLKDPLPGQAMRQALAEQTGMGAREVQIWMQNRRQKEKRQQHGRGPLATSRSSSPPTTTTTNASATAESKPMLPNGQFPSVLLPGPAPQPLPALPTQPITTTAAVPQVPVVPRAPAKVSAAVSPDRENDNANVKRRKAVERRKAQAKLLATSLAPVQPTPPMPSSAPPTVTTFDRRPVLGEKRVSSSSSLNLSLSTTGRLSITDPLVDRPSSAGSAPALLGPTPRRAAVSRMAIELIDRLPSSDPHEPSSPPRSRPVPSHATGVTSSTKSPGKFDPFRHLAALSRPNPSAVGLKRSASLDVVASFAAKKKSRHETVVPAPTKKRERTTSGEAEQKREKRPTLQHSRSFNVLLDAVNATVPSPPHHAGSSVEDEEEEEVDQLSSSPASRPSLHLDTASFSSTGEEDEGETSVESMVSVSTVESSGPGTPTRIPPIDAQDGDKGEKVVEDQRDRECAESLLGLGSGGVFA